MIKALITLVQSTANFHHRFFMRPPDKHQNLTMIREEVQELTDEIEAGNLEDAYLELADVFVTVFGQVLANGASAGQVAWFLEQLTPEALTDAILEVAKKNDAKTWDTHTIVNGKVTRRAGKRVEQIHARRV